MSLPEQSRGNRLLLGIEQRLHSESSWASTFPRGAYPLTNLTAGIGFLRTASENRSGSYRRSLRQLRPTLSTLREWAFDLKKYFPS